MKSKILFGGLGVLILGLTAFAPAFGVESQRGGGTDEEDPPREVVRALERVVVARLEDRGWALGSQSVVDLRALIELAAHRLGRDPLPGEMRLARAEARALADALVAEAEGAGARPPHITRVAVAEAIARLSPGWPFTVKRRAAVVPPVPRGRVRAVE